MKKYLVLKNIRVANAGCVVTDENDKDGFYAYLAEHGWVKEIVEPKELWEEISELGFHEIAARKAAKVALTYAMRTVSMTINEWHKMDSSRLDLGSHIFETLNKEWFDCHVKEELAKEFYGPSLVESYVYCQVCLQKGIAVKHGNLPCPNLEVK